MDLNFLNKLKLSIKIYCLIASKIQILYIHTSDFFLNMEFNDFGLLFKFIFRK